jgi:pimeloyl-ACP methyl ester carboxylesterase
VPRSLSTIRQNLVDVAYNARRRVFPRRAEPFREAGPAGPFPPRTGDFDRDAALATYQRGIEIEDRLYNYVFYPGAGDALCVHFSAFFGEWGDRRPYRALYQGYFHRMRMFWPLTSSRFLFLCDTFGADRNGTYYKGEHGDFFVERAMSQILDRVQEQVGIPNDRVVLMGSSMGATAAARFALKRQAAGAVLVVPHLDLDLCARYQGRARHVAAMLGDDDVEAPRHYPVTREIRSLTETVPTGPRLAIQSIRDDVGVHSEQVLPLVEMWSGRGGVVDLDERETGGHTSEYATADWFDERLKWCLASR